MTEETPIDIAAMLTEVGVDAATASPAMSVGESTLIRSDVSMASVPAFSTADDITTDTLLGEGETSAVYLGTQHSMRRRVAVRTVHKTRRTPAAPGYVVSEAWMLGAFEHPNILPVYDLKRDNEGMPLVVMKALEALPWSEIVGETSHPLACPPELDRIEFEVRRMISVCSALEHAHHRGVIHRDVKPDNILIGRDGTLYLHGWDLAVSLDEDPTGRFPTASEQDQIAGTPAYMAPELATCDIGLVGQATDVYLAAATFHEVLIGEPRHLGENVFDAFYSAVASAPVEYDPEQVPAELAAILNKAMSAAPHSRFESARELRHALEAFLRHRPSVRLVGHASLAHDEFDRAVDAKSEEFIVRELFATAFTAYSSAREFWPANDDATEGMERLQRGMLEYELRHGSAVRARDLLARIGYPSSQLLARVAAAERREEDERSVTIPHVKDPTEVETQAPDRGRQLMVGAAALGPLVVLSVMLAAAKPEDAVLFLAQAFLAVLGFGAFGLWLHRQNAA